MDTSPRGDVLMLFVACMLLSSRLYHVCLFLMSFNDVVVDDDDDEEEEDVVEMGLCRSCIPPCSSSADKLRASS